MSLIPINQFNPIEYLINRKYPLVRQAANSNRFKDKATLEMLAVVVKASEKFKSQLSSMTPQEIMDLVQEERRKEGEEAAAKGRREEEGRFFNGITAKADFSYWSKAAYWSIDEAVALSFGRNPRIVNLKALKSYTGISLFAHIYQARFELAERATKAGILFNPVGPGMFIAWAKRLNLDFPSELESLIEAQGTLIGDWKTLYDKEVSSHLKTIKDYGTEIEKLMGVFQNQQSQLIAKHQEAIQAKDKRIDELASQLADRGLSQPEKPLSQKERDSLLKIVIATAIDGLGYVPTANRSPTAREITDAVLRLGLEIDEDTVRTHLKAAAQLLPQNLTEQIKP